MLPTLNPGLSSGSIGGKGRKISIPQETRATKVCKVCMCGFDKKAVSSEHPITPGICESCQTTLDEGYVALVSAEKYAFVRSERLKDLAGQVINISGPGMEKIQKEYEVNWSTRHEDPNATGND